MFKGKAKLAGVRAPRSAPKFTSTRGVALWRQNNRVPSVPASGRGADPIFGSDSTGQNVIYHYQTDGNAYLRQAWDSLMAFEPDNTPANADVFAFKCLVKPHAVHGRRLIYSNKGKGADSGGIFIDIMDGKARLGWYDTSLKKEVWVETSAPVFEPNYWHYVYVRKRYPDPSLGSGGWVDTIFDRNTGTMGDVFCVRRFPEESVSIHEYRRWDYFPKAAVRTFIGFTTDEEAVVGDSSGVGLVSRTDRTFTGTVGGVVTASGSVFSEDMVGKLFCPGTGSLQGTSYIIQSFTSSTIVTVVKLLDGSVANMTGLGSCPGGVYNGVRLVKSEGYASSIHVDQASHDIELFGSHLAEDPTAGVMPFVGEFASFAYGVLAGATPAIFETSAVDRADDGADQFGNVTMSGSSAVSIGELHVNGSAGANCFTAVDTQAYAGDPPTSSVPNEALALTLDAASSSRAMPPEWKFVNSVSIQGKPVRVRCAFYDPEQAQVSAPGPELVIAPNGEDATNTTRSWTITLDELPRSPDRGPIETWVYATAPGGFTFFKTAEVKGDATSMFLDIYARDYANGALLELDNWPPPECSVLEVSQGSLVCANLKRWVNSDEGVPTDFPDVAVFSKPNKPLSFPAENLIGVPDASREGITGLRDFNGRLIITKRDSMHRASLRQGAAISELVSKRFGCASGQTLIEHEGALTFWGKRGLYAYDGAGIPRWIGDNVETLFQTGVEPGFALRSVAAVNPRRNQIVMTIRETDELYTSHRLSMELAGGGIRFSRYEGPNVTALADHATDSAEVGFLVAGTEEGFFVWMDRDDTDLLMMGAAATHGDSSLVANGVPSTTAVPVTGTLDTSLAGPRGAILRWTGGEAVVLFASGSTLYLDRPVAMQPIDLDPLTLGKSTRYWETRWLDFEVAEGRKRARFLDVVTTMGSETITVTAYKDFGATPYTVIPYTSPNPPASAIDTSLRAVTRFDIGHLNANHLKFRFESTEPFEMIELVLRVSDGDAY